MRSNVRLALANRFPALGAARRFARAARDRLGAARATYSQHGEDRILFDEIRRAGWTSQPYVDVGANHPSDISNTYLLYREGMHGVVIEPNRELITLHRWVRPRDIALPVGCGSHDTLAKFFYSSTPVTSSFEESTMMGQGTRVLAAEYLPVFTLDTIVRALGLQRISLISIDTEGRDLDVLAGARETLERTLLLCVEFSSPEGEAELRRTVSSPFEVIGTYGCNLVWRNTRY